MIATITSTTWLMTGMGVGVVFVILVLLVFILQIFNLVANKAHATVKSVQADINTKQQDKAFSEASEQDKAAVAIAVYLYYNDAHDHESGVLTIKQTGSKWQSTLNPRL